MDIQKEREAFEAYMTDRYKRTVDQRICINSDGDYMAWDMGLAWRIWQEAKAQAVPEGYVLVPKEPTMQMMIRGIAAMALGVGKTDIYEEVSMVWVEMVEAQGLKR